MRIVVAIQTRWMPLKRILMENRCNGQFHFVEGEKITLESPLMILCELFSGKCPFFPILNSS